MDEHCRACLADFGHSTLIFDCLTLNTVTHRSDFTSTVRFMAPELHNPELFGLNDATPTRESDVYSFAMVMWEVCLVGLMKSFAAQ